MTSDSAGLNFGVKTRAIPVAVAHQGVEASAIAAAEEEVVTETATTDGRLRGSAVRI